MRIRYFKILVALFSMGIFNLPKVASGAESALTMPDCGAVLSGAGSSFEQNGSVFEIKELSKADCIVLNPRAKLSSKFDSRSPIARDLDTIWDLSKFKTARSPMFLDEVDDPTSFSMRSNSRVLDMPIKMRGSNEYRLPGELRQFSPVIQQIIDHEHAMLPPETLRKYHAYLTIDQGWVDADRTHRNPGNHVDGFQGSRIKVKNEINHSYLVMDNTPTLFYPHSFDFGPLDESIHDFFREMDRLGDEDRAVAAPLNEIVLIDAYTVHRATRARHGRYRTFFRLSYDVKEFDRRGNTKNPHFEYDWEMVTRDVHGQLTEFKPAEWCQSCGVCPRGRAPGPRADR